MIKIYHNARCGKSREGLQILENSGKEFEVINYLQQPPTKEELKLLLKNLGVSAMELVRQKEKVWIENYKGKALSEEEIIEAMVQNPILMERPIVVNGDKAVVGRPPENITAIL